MSSTNTLTKIKNIICWPSTIHPAVSDGNQNCQLRISQIRKENIKITTSMATKTAQNIGQNIAHHLTKILP